MVPMLFWLASLRAALSLAGRVAFGSAYAVAIAIPVVVAFLFAGVSDGAVAGGEGSDTLRAGETPLLQLRKLTLTASHKTGGRDRELANAARQAAKALVDRQQSAGYWLTSYSDTTRFENPHQEINTFLSAIIIDIVTPVAAQAGLADTLQRARDFLATQIEDNGLVRYKGKIGTCTMTPDADDTALVWRVAPGERTELLATAIGTLSQFRRADGLYRTWLAPRDQFVCLDASGKDPNPPDIGIQMHVLMLLAQADPPAARALCEALQKRSGDEDIWVYYKKAPPIVILRMLDLRRIGCPLELPQALLQTTVPGQEVWIEATQLLQRMENTKDRDTVYAETAALLDKLASDGFSLLTRAPPFIYHNDLTASLRRFYWSEELGYALWLRLYYENERARLRLHCRGGDAKQGCIEP
jgi:hypothetical protein